MKPTTYNWRCYKCEAVNLPEATACTLCRFPARPNGRDFATLRPTRPEPAAPRVPQSPAKSAWKFVPVLPESLLAVIAVLSGPVFFFQLIGEHRFGPAVFLFCGGLGSLWLFAFGIRKKSNLLAYVTVLAILAVAVHTMTLTKM